FLFQAPRSFDELANLLVDVLAATAQQARNVAKDLIRPSYPLICRLTRHRLNAPHASGDAGFAHDLEKSDVTGSFDVSTAAEFPRKISDRKHAHIALVLFAKQRHRAAGD